MPWKAHWLGEGRFRDDGCSMGEESLRSGLGRTRWAIQKDASRRLQTQTLEGGRVLDGPLQRLPEPALHVLVSTNIAPCDCTSPEPTSLVKGLPTCLMIHSPLSDCKCLMSTVSA